MKIPLPVHDWGIHAPTVKSHGLKSHDENTNPLRRLLHKSVVIILRRHKKNDSRISIFDTRTPESPLFRCMESALCGERCAQTAHQVGGSCTCVWFYLFAGSGISMWKPLMSLLPKQNSEIASPVEGEHGSSGCPTPETKNLHYCVPPTMSAPALASPSHNHTYIKSRQSGEGIGRISQHLVQHFW